MKKFLVCVAFLSLFATTGCVDKEIKATSDNKDGIKAVHTLADAVGTTADKQGTDLVGGLSDAFEQLKEIGK